MWLYNDESSVLVKDPFGDELMERKVFDVKDGKRKMFLFQRKSVGRWHFNIINFSSMKMMKLFTSGGRKNCWELHRLSRIIFHYKFKCYFWWNYNEINVKNLPRKKKLLSSTALEVRHSEENSDILANWNLMKVFGAVFKCSHCWHQLPEWHSIFIIKLNIKLQMIAQFDIRVWDEETKNTKR